MKRLTNTILFLTMMAMTAVAQDFKLYYAKNVTDVTHFSDDVDELAKQLDWKEVANNSIDGNQKEVYDLKEMLSSTRMKGLEDQQQFWRMRDHTLLCFRIDGGDTSGTYSVDVDYGSNAEGQPNRKSLTTSKYFFANMPQEAKDITIKVCRDGDLEHPFIFRYSVYDWDNDNVYLFQLDQKRQSTGDTYRMEYVTSYVDAEGEQHSQSNMLELQATKFQSFYLPEGHTLSEVFFLTGNSEEGDVKLRVKLEDIHPGIDMDWRLNIPRLSSEFNLDKHENREMMNFNWLGTGLFEKYDTLFLKLYDHEGMIVSDAEINVHRVNEKGQKVNDNKLCYLGYDSKSEQHRVLTYGHPAYIEILADGCMPTLFRYKGAAEAGSKIVSEDLCSAKLTLREGYVDDNEIGMSDQYLRYLNDLHVVAARKGVDYCVCDVREIDLASKLSVDTLVYMENAGNDYPKLYNNDPIKNLAQLEVVFSSPKGSKNPTCQLTVTELKNKKQHVAANQELNVVSAKEFTRFNRDYYFLRLSLVDVVPQNSVCSLSLTTPQSTYEDFPMLMNLHFDPEAQKKSAEDQTRKSTDAPSGSEGVAKADQESKLGLSFPPTFKFDLGPMKMKTGLTIDVLKQMISFFVSGSVNAQNQEEKPGPKLSKARENAKNVSEWNYSTFKADPNGKDKDNPKADVSFAESKLKFDDWVKQESASIFDVSKNHVGLYYGGGFKIALQKPMIDSLHFQLQEASLFVEGGAGFCWGIDKKSGAMAEVAEGLEYIGLVPDFGAVVDANIRVDAGIKSFDKKMVSSMSANNMGLFTNLTISGRIGAWASVRTPQTCLGGFQMGFRAGAKTAFQAGMAVPFDCSDYGAGCRYMLLGIVELFANFHALFLHWDGSLYFRAGHEWLFPNDDNTNPFHKDFPHWIKKNGSRPNLRTIANSYRVLKAPEPSSLGAALLPEVASNANPHFIDSKHVVFNNVAAPGNYNDDHVALYDMDTKTTTTLSDGKMAAMQHMRSKRGESEVVVFQQLTETVDNDAINDENSLVKNQEILSKTIIRSTFRQQDGTWKQFDVTADDGFTDQHPVVTIQDDGKAACVYQHGQMKKIDVPSYVDPIMSYRLVGELQLRTFDGNTWSAPTKLFDIDADHQPAQYDLFMRGDTVLVGINMTDSKCASSTFTYASKPLDSPTVTYVDETLKPLNFFMNRVGQNAVIAMLYERPDSTRDVFVRTLAMNGRGDGRSGCDLGLSQSSPDRVKIICDRSDDNTNDFAVLWTEANNILLDPVEGNKANEKMGAVLNASRVHLSMSPSVSYPISMGAETDSLYMADFDGFLDDSYISVVYTLAESKSGSAIVMHNEKQFTNSFESDVTYTRNALLGSSLLPVNVTIRNTGTSAIKSAVVTINGEQIEIPNSFVPPLKQTVFTVQYPITDSFDGYMESSVEVEYANVFKVRQQLSRRGVMRNLLRQTSETGSERVAIGDIDCNVVNRKVEDGGTNIFTVELIDRSSRGLIPGTAVLVGVYLHSALENTLTNEKGTIVNVEDFHQQGGVRKAYAKVRVSGITEPISAFIVPKIIDQTVNDINPFIVANSRASNNAPYVTLFPSADPSKIVRPSLDKEPEGHRVGVKYEENGVRLSRLEADDEIRLFNAQGMAVHISKPSASSLFIPLNQHGVYILSAGGEVFKFKY